MRLIDADALVFTDGREYVPTGKYITEAEIKKEPTIDPVKRGKWLPYEFGDYHWHKCSVCGIADEYITTIDRGIYGKHDLESAREYCPHCGAHMERSEE